jgi:hypothetical protein
MRFQFIRFNPLKFLRKIQRSSIRGYFVIAFIFLIIVSGMFAFFGFSKSSEKGFSGTWEDAGNIGIVLMINETEDEKIKGFVHFKSRYNAGVILPIEQSCWEKKYVELGVHYGESCYVDPENSLKFEMTLFNENKIIGCMIDNRKREVYDFVLSRISKKEATEFWKMAVK